MFHVEPQICTFVFIRKYTIKMGTLVAPVICLQLWPHPSLFCSMQNFEAGVIPIVMSSLWTPLISERVLGRPVGSDSLQQDGDDLDLGFFCSCLSHNINSTAL